MKGSYHIAVIEDNPFYNKLLCENLKMLLLNDPPDPALKISIHPFSDPESFLLCSRSNFGLIFLDYFFDNNTNASEMILPIRRKCNSGKIYLLSEVLAPNEENQPIFPGITGFMGKDENTFRKCEAILRESLYEDS